MSKTYLGKGTERKYHISFSVCLSDIPKEEITESKNGKKYLKLCIGQMKEKDKYGNTHTVWVDDYKKPDTDLP
jgi:hypothetical protein